MSAKSATVGLVGVGAMGSRMARRLRAAGYRLVLNDVKGPVPELLDGSSRFVGTVGGVVEAAEVVLLSLPTPDTVDEVVDQIAEASRAGKARAELCIDTSTCGPRASERASATLKPVGVAFIDAPVSGGITGAASGTLTFMLAGADADVAKAYALLENLGSRLIHVGSVPGMGQVAKVANNMLEAAHMVATAEAMVVAEKAGINARKMLEILNASSGRSSVTEEAFVSSVITRKFDEGFALSLCLKDVRLCNEVTRGFDIPAWVGASVENMLSLTAATVDEENPDYTSVVRVYEQWADVSIGSAM